MGKENAIYQPRRWSISVACGVCPVDFLIPSSLMRALVLAACFGVGCLCSVSDACVVKTIDFLIPSSLMLVLVLAACGLCRDACGMCRMLVECRQLIF